LHISSKKMEIENINNNNKRKLDDSAMDTDVDTQTIESLGEKTSYAVAIAEGSDQRRDAACDAASKRCKLSETLPDTDKEMLSLLGAITHEDVSKKLEQNTEDHVKNIRLQFGSRYYNCSHNTYDNDSFDPVQSRETQLRNAIDHAKNVRACDTKLELNAQQYTQCFVDEAVNTAMKAPHNLIPNSKYHVIEDMETLEEKTRQKAIDVPIVIIDMASGEKSDYILMPFGTVTSPHYINLRWYPTKLTEDNMIEFTSERQVALQSSIDEQLEWKTKQELHDMEISNTQQKIHARQNAMNLLLSTDAYANTKRLGELVVQIHELEKQIKEPFVNKKPIEKYQIIQSKIRIGLEQQIGVHKYFLLKKDTKISGDISYPGVHVSLYPDGPRQDLIKVCKEVHFDLDKLKSVPLFTYQPYYTNGLKDINRLLYLNDNNRIKKILEIRTYRGDTYMKVELSKEENPHDLSLYIHTNAYLHSTYTDSTLTGITIV
jgi:hypothetical protein